MTIGTSLGPALLELSEALGHRTIAGAESCTAGLVMAALADLESASQRFKGGVVAYTGEEKSDVLGIGQSLIDTHGCISSECAAAMASRVREMFGAEVGLAVTGVAGPTTQEGKPVGLTYVAVANRASTEVREYRFGGGRAANRIAAVEAVLHLAAETVRRR